MIRELLEDVLREYPSARASGQFGKDHEIWSTFAALEKALLATKCVQSYPALKIKWSAGQGNWAKVPWVAFMDSRETTTTQKGVYCVLLFRQDLSGVYLTFNQGVTDPIDRLGATEGRAFLGQNADAIKERQPDLSQRGFATDRSIDLRADPGLGNEYEASTISHKLYEKDLVPSDAELEQDLAAVLGQYRKYVDMKNATNHWIFQASPQYYDIQGALAALKQQRWTVAQFKDRIRAGDLVYVWEAGPNAGILATATILQDPAQIKFPEAERPFVRDQEKFDGLHFAVALRIDRVLENRLARTQLQQDPVLKSLSVITFPRGTNFEVTAEQAKRLNELLGEVKEAPAANGENLMKVTRNLILFGPPGTGKTFKTIRKAVELCDGSVAGDQKSVQDRYRALREENRIEFVTFHQSYGYEDFVEGIRPVLTRDIEGEELNQVRYELRAGAFKRICSFAMSSGVHSGHDVPFDLSRQRVWKMSLGRRSDEAGIYDQCIEKRLIRIGYGLGLDFKGCNDRQAIAAKFQQEDKDIKDADFGIDAVNRFKNEMEVGDLFVVSDGNFAFRAIGRVAGPYFLLPDRVEYPQARAVEWLLVLDKSLPVENILTKIFSQATIYRLRGDVLREAALRGFLSGEAKQPRNHVLIIDEINRGNIAKVFGELITLIEADKRIGGQNELRATLPYSGEHFGVPGNLYILGTMNTADRSIAFLDTALRRRFQFEEMLPDMEVLRRTVGSNGVIESIDVPLLISQINRRIEALFDRDHAIGHAYFIGVKTLADLRDVFRFQIIPLLQEYFYSDWSKICAVLGCPHDAATGKPLTKNPFPLIKVEPFDAIAIDFDGAEPSFRYELNGAMGADGIDLAECFRWVLGPPAGPQKNVDSQPGLSSQES